MIWNESTDGIYNPTANLRTKSDILIGLVSAENFSSHHSNVDITISDVTKDFNGRQRQLRTR